MRIHVWAKTDVVGSKTEDYIEVSDNLTDEEIEQEAYNYIVQFVDWGWEKEKAELK